MKNIAFKIYHPSLDIISDRTFRSLLKKLSTLFRGIQIQEVFYLINQSDLSSSEKQSLRNRLEGQLSHIESYYVESIERGSLVISGVVTAVALYLLKVTLGETLKEAWKRSKAHKNLVAYLSGSKEREEVIDRNIRHAIDTLDFSGFVIENIERELIGNETVQYTINIVSEREKAIYQRIDVDLIIKELNKEI